MNLTRRDLLGLGGMTLMGAALAPAPARAQAPKRGGTLSLRLWDLPHFYGPNLGFDWGGRLTAAWLDR